VELDKPGIWKGRLGILNVQVTQKCHSGTLLDMTTTCLCRMHTCTFCRNVTSVHVVTVAFALVRFAARSSHTSVGFAASTKGYYITQLEQVCTCFCARLPIENLSSSGPGYFSYLFFIFPFLRIVILNGVELQLEQLFCTWYSSSK
jgi:hypothetical protein